MGVYEDIIVDFGFIFCEIEFVEFGGCGGVYDDVRVLESGGIF